MNSGVLLEENMESAIRALLTKVQQTDDKENGKKIEQLLQKMESGSLYIAFCGHFSAGKSSLINKLCGHQLLPSSPIPTSANIVRISSGESGAIVVHRVHEGICRQKFRKCRLTSLPPTAAMEKR